MKRKLGFEIGKTSRLIRRVMDNSSQKEYIDKVTGTHGWALGYFHRNKDKDIFQKDFEKEFDIRRSTASHILSLMEENGLISMHDFYMFELVCRQLEKWSNTKIKN